MLEGFKKFNVTVGPSSVTIGKNGLGFSKTAVIRMNKCEYVCLLINEESKKIAIQECRASDESATKFYANQKTSSVRWNNRELLNTLTQMMNWDLSEKNYKIEGEYLSEEKALVFDLTKAKVVSSKEDKIDE